MRQATITISGTYGGPIWMPACICAKRFKHTVAADDTLREAVLRVLNDGDFQSCSIAEGEVNFIRRLPDRFHREHRRTLDISQFPSVADCVATGELLDGILCCFTEED